MNYFIDFWEKLYLFWERNEFKFNNLLLLSVDINVTCPSEMRRRHCVLFCECGRDNYLYILLLFNTCDPRWILALSRPPTFFIMLRNKTCIPQDFVLRDYLCLSRAMYLFKPRDIRLMYNALCKKKNKMSEPLVSVHTRGIWGTLVSPWPKMQIWSLPSRESEKNYKYISQTCETRKRVSCCQKKPRKCHNYIGFGSRKRLKHLWVYLIMESDQQCRYCLL